MDTKDTIIRDGLRLLLQSLAADRAAAVERAARPFDEKIAQVEALLADDLDAPSLKRVRIMPPPDVPEVGEKEKPGRRASGADWLAAREKNRRVMARVRELLTGGAFLSKSEILDALNADGIEVDPSRPEKRLVQLLSAAEDLAFDSQRGWHIKGETPKAAGTANGASFATTSA